MPDYKALVVSEVEEKKFAGEVRQLSTDELPAGDVLIRVEYSSLNYKDALSASGNKGVTREYPHTPGIDAAGIVAESSSKEIAVDTEVIITGYDLGMNTAGGFGQYIRVPAQWVIRKPDGLSLRECMILGTAGFTAALCIDKLLKQGLDSSAGEVLVSGATGGVGSIAVALLAKLGFSVVASTGKAEARDWLENLGAGTVIDRQELAEANSKPLLKPRWSAAVDSVGGDTLFNIVKSLHYGGSVAACGLVQSPMFQASVFPFILRGVNLLGVDSAELPLATKQAVWDKLADAWKLSALDNITTEIGLDELSASLQTVLQGKARGRYLLNLWG